MVAPYPLLFFGGQIRVFQEEGHDMISVDDFIKFRSPTRIATLVKVANATTTWCSSTKCPGRNSPWLIDLQEKSVVISYFFTETATTLHHCPPHFRFQSWVRVLELHMTSSKDSLQKLRIPQIWYNNMFKPVMRWDQPRSQSLLAFSPPAKRPWERGWRWDLMPNSESIRNTYQEL